MKTNRYFFFLLIVLISHFTSHAQSFIINTVAGNNTFGFSGDGGLTIADTAKLDAPADVAVDASGNIYIADYFNNRIRKVNTNGIISTIAGGIEGYAGDGGPASEAKLEGPIRVVLDDTGNLYIDDIYNNVIRKVNTQGIISTVAGNGFGNGLGLGNGGFSGDGGAATAAELNAPFGLAVSHGNIYISDENNYRIRKVDAHGIITTIAGNGTQGFSGDSGLATAAEIYDVTSIAVDDTGNIYIADYYNNRIRKINTHNIITTIAGNGTYGFSGDGGAATDAEFRNPKAIALDSSGNLYIADFGNNLIREVNTSGIISTIAGHGTPPLNYGYLGDGGLATSATLYGPPGVAVDKSGNVFIADQSNEVIRELTSTATLVSEPAVKNEAVSIYPNPNNGNFVIQLANAGQSARVQIFNALGENTYAATLNTSGNVEINLRNATPGIYLYRILTANGQAVASGKLVIER